MSVHTRGRRETRCQRLFCVVFPVGANLVLADDSHCDLLTNLFRAFDDDVIAGTRLLPVYCQAGARTGTCICARTRAQVLVHGRRCEYTGAGLVLHDDTHLVCFEV